MNYQEASEILQGRNKQSKKMANHTYLQRRDGDIALKLHDTDVVLFKANGDIILNSGGYHTLTTKDRINSMIDGRLWQKNGVWYLDGERYEKGIRFQDGITIKANGKIKNYAKDDPKADKKLKAKVREYAQLYVDKMPLPMPSAGDCWYCHLITQENQTLGEATKDKNHILSHIKEGYVVPSLAFRAVRLAGYSDYVLATIFGQGGGLFDNLDKQILKRSVYRYCVKQLGYAR